MSSSLLSEKKGISSANLIKIKSIWYSDRWVTARRWRWRWNDMNLARRLRWSDPPTLVHNAYWRPELLCFHSTPCDYYHPHPPIAEEPPWLLSALLATTVRRRRWLTECLLKWKCISEERNKFFRSKLMDIYKICYTYRCLNARSPVLSSRCILSLSKPAQRPGG